MRKIKAADAVVIGTPVYGTHGSPATQQLLIRLEHDRRERGDTRLAGKPAVVVVGPPGSGAGAAAADVRRRLEAHGMRVADAAMPSAGTPESQRTADVDELAGTLLAALVAPARLTAPYVPGPGGSSASGPSTRDPRRRSAAAVTTCRA